MVSKTTVGSSILSSPAIENLSNSDVAFFVIFAGDDFKLDLLLPSVVPSSSLKYFPYCFLYWLFCYINYKNIYRDRRIYMTEQTINELANFFQ